MIVQVLLDSRVIELVMSSKFARKQKSKLKKKEKFIYMRNINGSFNKKRLIKHTVKINFYYQKYKEKTEIDVIREQK